MNKIFLFSFFCALNGQAYISIISPKNNAKVTAGDEIDISWSHNNITGKVIVSYSWDKKKWVTIDIINIVEKQVWWEVPNTYDLDGRIFIKVQSLQYPDKYSSVNLRLPKFRATAFNNNTDQYVIITKNLDNIRSGPATSYSIIGKCRKDELYDYLGEEGNWYIIRYNNEVAYTHKTNGTMFSYSDADYRYDVVKEFFCYCLLPIIILGGLLSN